MKIDLEKIKKVHFIGIGGVGVSAIARMMLDLGKDVSGSDSSASRITDGLEKIGARISIGHDEKNLDSNADLVVYTIAIPKDNPELMKAERLEVELLSYPEMLGVASEGFYTIAVSGTHGKTTTTAMLSDVLIKSGLDPTVIVGSLLKERGSNYVRGESKYFLVEACEYKRSFLNLKPKILIINNIEEDHLDYYKDLEDIQSAFKELAQSVPKDGFIICNSKDSGLLPVLDGAVAKVIDYTNFIERNLKLNIPGEHNLSNAGVVLAVSDILGIKKEKAFEILKSYSGVWRRFEFKGETKNGVLIYDDYAHHPTEVKMTLKGARNFFKRKIFVVFQPHLYSRTRQFLKEFGKSFSDADHVIILPIYAARELEDSTINSEMLVEEINKNSNNATYQKDFDDCAEYLKKETEKGDVVITVGAGDVFRVGDMMR